jgi:hypothetical protein
METLNQITSEQQITENKQNTCFPNTSSLANAAQTIQFDRSYWTVYVLQTDNNYTFSFEYHNLHILVSISSCSWYEFHMGIFKHIAK